MTSARSSKGRPALRWHGGKWLLAPWIIDHMPPHRCYVEPYGGAASVLIRKPRVHAEIYNDLDGDVVNLFRVLREPTAATRLVEMLRLTPFARAEFNGAFRPCRSSIERARRLCIRSFMGFGSDGARTEIKTGFRSSSTRSGTTPATDWSNYPDALCALIIRLQGVTVERRNGLTCMATHDGPETVHYVDPPYMLATRQVTHRNHGYRHELSDAGHEALLAELPRLRGMVLLSGYASKAYDAALTGWRRVERKAFACGARPRTEILWLNPHAADRQPQPQLFAA